MSIIFKNVSKKFGRKFVLQNIDLTIQADQVYCVLGRNGAGKSTLINIACNLINADKGTVFINGQTYNSNAIGIKQSIGLQSQYETLIDDLNTFDYLQFIGRIYSMNKADITSQTKLLIDYFFENTTDLKKTIKTYSTGMKKKVSICAAFIHKPPFIFLDEPFANIDTIAANSLCKLIQAYKNSNRCIVISSHDLLYVNKVATNIGVIDNGSIVYNDKINNFRTGAGLDTDLLQYIQPKKDEDILLNQII